MHTYLHTQRAGRWLLVPFTASLAMLLAAILTGLWPLVSGIPLLGFLAWVFASLTIEVQPKELRWRFGPGLIRKRIPLAEVANARPVTTSIADGWGIHPTRFGWLYNVAGLTAVLIQLRDGDTFALGTDDPAGLIAALTQPATSA